MRLYAIELTAEDVMFQEGAFHQEFTDLLDCQQLSIFPPFPDYSLLSQSRAPKVLLKAVNEVVLSRRPVYKQQFGWLLLPLLRNEKVLAVLLGEEVNPKWGEQDNLSLLEQIADLFLERLQWEKRGRRDAETMLWRREELILKLKRAIEIAEGGSSLKPRRLLSDGPCPVKFSMICFLVAPNPEPWAGAGELWSKLGPRVAECLPPNAIAAHLGGGYLGVFWPDANREDAQVWAAGFLRNLTEGEEKRKEKGEDDVVVAGIATFPQDFYDDGPLLPWDRSDVEGGESAAAEVVRRAVLAVDVARNASHVEILSYLELRDRGLVSKRESAIEKRLSEGSTDDERGALLLVKLDDWNKWQQQLGSKEAAEKANEVFELSRGDCSDGATLDWVGPDRFGVFLQGADRDSAQQLARAIRKRVKAESDTTVSIGLSVHPCPGFTMSEILENARKALVHAGFFGSNTQTLFDATSLNINGDRLYEAGRMEEAVQEFQLALALDPHNVNVRNSLGVCYAQMGKFKEAVNEFSGVAALAAEDFMPHYNLGCALLSLERLDEAERVLIRAAELEPENPGVCFQLAKVYRRQDRLEEALVRLDRAVAMQPGWAQAWRLHGDCHLDKGADDEAMDSFKKALKFNGKDAAALSGLSICYGRSEANLEIALSLGRLSVELEPDNPQFIQRLADMLLKSQLIEEALEHCRRAISLAPEDEQIRSLQNKIADAQRASTS